MNSGVVTIKGVFIYVQAGKKGGDMCRALEMEDSGLFEVAERHRRLAERYSLYIQEMINLQRILLRPDISRRETRTKRYLDLKNRLIPALEAQLQS